MASAVAMLRPANTLTIREAGRKYGVPNTTLAGWVRRGLIRCYGTRTKRGMPILVIEADVATAALNYQPGRGHWNPRRVAEELTITA